MSELEKVIGYVKEDGMFSKNEAQIMMAEKAQAEFEELREYKNLYNQTAKELNAANHKLSEIRKVIGL